MPGDPVQLFTDRNESYVRFIRSVGYPAGLRAWFGASPLLRSGLRILDAGCGTGAAVLALREAMIARRLEYRSLHAFDLTPAMLDRFRAKLEEGGIEDIELARANVLELDTLPDDWEGYDLIVSASMLEYVPAERFAEALHGLGKLLTRDGHFVLFVTKRNWLTRPLIGRWWDSNLYSEAELRDAFSQAGFGDVSFRSFPARFRYLALWGHIVEAQHQRPST